MDINRTLQEALGLHQQGKLVDAERAYRAILQSQPTHATALHHLGLIASQSGQPQVAMDLVARSILLEPANQHFRANQVSMLDRLGERQAAEAAARKLVEERPADLKLRASFAKLLGKYRKFHEAIEHWEFILSRAPQDVDALFQSARMHDRAGDFAAAQQCYERALQINPNLSEAWTRLGTLALRNGQGERAIEVFQHALSRSPNDLTVLMNLATALLLQNRLSEARQYATRAANLAPQDAEVLSSLADVLLNHGDVQEAVAALRRAMELAPDSVECCSDLLFARNYLEADGEEERKHHQAFQQVIDRSIKRSLPSRRAVRSAGRIRVGYVSADFKLHPVGLFVQPLLAHHDRSRFEIHCFSNSLFRDAMTDRIRDSVDEFHTIAPGTSFDEFEALVLAKEIDILIDLAGHTAGGCLSLFARKPAPVQITYLGYPNTTGLSTINYRITDAVADPPGETDTFHTEKLLRLPGSFALFSPPPDAPEVSPSPLLTNGYITFGTLGRIEKWSEATLRRWAAVLAAVAGSRFRLVGRGYDKAEYREHVLARLSAHDIDASRVDMVGHQPFSEYLSGLCKFDLLLDTNPFNCHTTTLQALYMGVPTVTLAGRLHRSRMGASVMKALGLSELVASTDKEYVSTAVGLAQTPSRLTEMRTTLRQRLLHSSLCDGPAFTKAFEALLLQACNESGERNSQTGCCIGQE